MSKHAIEQEEIRLDGITDVSEYPDFHERHRAFPAIFEDRGHKRIIDTSAGVGVTAQRIRDHYDAELLCNDISPTALRLLNKMGLPTTSFSIDDPESPFPFDDGSFDAVISLATIEHLVHVDHFVQEVRRILSDDGYFYISTPNYASILYLSRYLLKGRSFHNPVSPSSRMRYEFYAHFRYFTYRTLLEFVSFFGFRPEAVYLPVPEGSTRFLEMRESSPLKAALYRFGVTTIYRLGSPRWAPEPVLCFQKSEDGGGGEPRKVLL